jgi:hypothetical protein
LYFYEYSLENGVIVNVNEIAKVNN